ncbi:Flp pilus assembly protein CpaB [Roseibium salinum]|nr:Flp pilus assembly protein CpaB [Roseibium salinum]
MRSTRSRQSSGRPKKLPEGAFQTIEEILGDGEQARFVKGSIEPGEPVLATKITGFGERATLSSAVTPGMKAVSIGVNDVLGVAGFVLPGDRVDILLTRTQQRSDTAGAYTDVLLQGVKVLAIDQLADDRTNKPSVVRTVTLEVSTNEAQKLVLAQRVGQLSLALRNNASAAFEQIQPVNVADLGGAPVSFGVIGDVVTEELSDMNDNDDIITKTIPRSRCYRCVAWCGPG